MSYCSSGCYCPDYYKLINMDQKNYIIVKEISGILATLFSAITLIPQIYISCRTKGKETMSYSFLLITFLSVIFWFIYGLLIASVQTLLLEIVVGINVIILFSFKLAYNINQYKIKKQSSAPQIENNIDDSTENIE